MSFNQGNWAARFGALGDEAEGVYSSVFPQHHRTGLDRPPFNVGGMAVDLRNIPDFLERERFVEIMGIGSDLTLKLKVEKLQSKMRWTVIGPVDLFVWSRKENGWYRAPIEEWFKAALKHGKWNEFQVDGNAYVGIKTRDFPCQLNPLKEAA